MEREYGRETEEELEGRERQGGDERGKDRGK
jgi:hypothetical protein